MQLWVKWAFVSMVLPEKHLKSGCRAPSPQMSFVKSRNTVVPAAGSSSSLQVPELDVFCSCSLFNTCISCTFSASQTQNMTPFRQQGAAPVLTVLD